MASVPRPGEGLVPWERPAPINRAFHSAAIEQRIEKTAALITDKDLRRLFEVAFPNTLDTTIVAGGNDDEPDTFVLTGDISAMWLRDSTAQLWPYLSSATEDPNLDRLIRGAIRRQASQVLLDPYANAFLPEGGPVSGPMTKRRCGREFMSANGSRTLFRLSSGCPRATGV